MAPLNWIMQNPPTFLCKRVHMLGAGKYCDMYFYITELKLIFYILFPVSHLKLNCAQFPLKLNNQNTRIFKR